MGTQHIGSLALTPQVTAKYARGDTSTTVHAQTS